MSGYMYSPGVRNSPVYRKKKPAPKKIPAASPPWVPPPYVAPNPADFGPGGPPGGSFTDPPPAGTPDYAALINSDPTLVAFRAALQGQSVSDKAAHDAAIRRAYIQFGGHPALGDVSGLIDPLTQKLADEATSGKISTTYRLGATHDTAEAQIRNALAARGLAHSGEAGTQFQHEATAYGQANYDATQKLLDYVGGIKAGLAAAERNRQLQMLQAEGDAAARQASYPWNQPAEPPPPPGAAPTIPSTGGPPGGYPTTGGTVFKGPVKKKRPGGGLYGYGKGQVL